MRHRRKRLARLRKQADRRLTPWQRMMIRASHERPTPLTFARLLAAVKEANRRDVFRPIVLPIHPYYRKALGL